MDTPGVGRPQALDLSVQRAYDTIMPNRSRKKADLKNPAAVALGKLGGKKGGRARAAKLTPEERSAIAKKAAETRWKKKKSP